MNSFSWIQQGTLNNLDITVDLDNMVTIVKEKKAGSLETFEYKTRYDEDGKFWWFDSSNDQWYHWSDPEVYKHYNDFLFRKMEQEIFDE